MYTALHEAIIQGQAVATATLIARASEDGALPIGTKMLVYADGRTSGSLGDPGLDRRAREDSMALLEAGENRSLEYADPRSESGSVQIFIETFLPAPELFMIGGVHIAHALVPLAKVLGFRTVIVDAREAFASQERFAQADEVVIAWPDEALTGRLSANSYVAVLTHDPKLDDPALHVALNSKARYIGALGSLKTHNARLLRLREAGFNDEQLTRIYGPIGLSIGAKTPAEIALSILAQIVQVQHQE
ncbi:xanthine dehydrogenase [Candidatus Gracilibacteria bacterium]|nr:xanthine dehydrogenase [Candidatus Gracilibacteria bacterium]